MNLSYTITENAYIFSNGKEYATGGIFDNTGKFLETSKTREYYDEDCGNLSNFTNINYEYENEEVIYLGCIWNNYGHLLLEGMARVWYYYSKNYNNEKFVISIGNEPSEITLQLLKLLKIKDKVIFIKNCAKFKKIIIPEMTYNYNQKILPEFFMPFNKIANDIAPKNVEKIFVSYRHYNKAVLGEENIEQIFIDNGFTVIIPELLSLTEQIAYFKNSKHIAGLWGSCLLNSIWNQRNDTVIFALQRSAMAIAECEVFKAKGFELNIIPVYYNYLPVLHTVGPYWVGITEEFKKQIIKYNYKIKNYKTNDYFKKFLKLWVSIYSNKELLKELNDKTNNQIVYYEVIQNHLLNSKSKIYKKLIKKISNFIKHF